MTRTIIKKLLIPALFLCIFLGPTKTQAFGDITAPQLVSISLDKQEIDTTSADQQVMITVHIVDDQAGACVYLGSDMDCNWNTAFGLISQKSGVQLFFDQPFQLISGNSMDGIYTATVTIPQGSPDGVWRVGNSQLADKVGNFRFLSEDTLMNTFGADVISVSNIGGSWHNENTLELKITPKNDEVGFDISEDDANDVTVTRESNMIYVLIDEKGNTLKITFEKIHEQNNMLQLIVKSLQYNDDVQIMVPEHKIQYVWQTNKNKSLTLLEQQFEIVGAYEEKMHYNDKKDQTLVTITENGQTYEEIRNGLSILNVGSKKDTLGKFVPQEESNDPVEVVTEDSVNTVYDVGSIQDAITQQYFQAGQDGTITDASQIINDAEVHVVIEDAMVVFPQNTVITGQNNENFDFSQFGMDAVTQNMRIQKKEILAALKIGVPDMRMHFSQPITLTMMLGRAYDGKEMTVQYQEDGETAWHDHGVCTVVNGECVFTTDHATTYIVNGDGTISGAEQNDITTDVQDVLSLNCEQTGNANDYIVELGELTPGTSVTGSTTCTVVTNSDGGYDLSVKRDDGDTTMDKNGDDATNIIDRTTWNADGAGNATTWNLSDAGLAFTVYNSTATKNEIWWGTGVSQADVNNKYAGFPTAYTNIMHHANYNNVATLTHIGYKLDVPTTQKSGTYSGDVTYQVTTAP